MKIPRRLQFGRPNYWLPAVATFAAAAVSLHYSWRYLLKRALPPKKGRLCLQGLIDPVEILRDQWGVPHIYAQNEPDLFFAQGFVHAQDRLFQMDINRRVGSGRLSEIVGSGGVATDRFARYFGWPRVAEVQAAHMSGYVARTMEAYCAGVNAFIRQGKLPMEFTLLAYKPERWHAVDTASWGAVLAWGLSVNWESEMLRLLLIETLGPEKTADLTMPYESEYQTVLPGGAVSQRLVSTLLRDYQQLITNIPLGKLPVGPGIGSNNWVISGQHTASGRPILANDPHLPPVFPSFWYENHLVGAGFNVSGFTMPGVPGVIIGHNEHIAWGATNAFPDVQDIYIERFHPDDPARYEVNGEWVRAEIVNKEIKVRGKKPVPITVRYTRHGPVFSDLLVEEEQDLALKWSSHTPNDHLRTIIEMDRAENWSQFRDSLRHWGFPSQNIVYADREGHIGYMMPGMVPIRTKRAGTVPVAGWTDQNEWNGWIPFDELPVLFNPSDGWIVTANNHVSGEDYPHFLTSEWLPDYRAKRIIELLNECNPLTLADNMRIQSDTLSLQAKRFLGLALPVLARQPIRGQLARYAYHILQAWDCNMRADRIAPSLFFGWLASFTAAVYEQAIGRELTYKVLSKSAADGFPLDPYLEVAPEVVMNWMNSGSPAWVGDIEPLLLPALQRALDLLEKRYGRQPKEWQWGKLHKLLFEHPLSIVPIVGRSWKSRSYPASGDGYTVNQSDVKMEFPPGEIGIIASCRMIIDVGEWDNSRAALPGGQSGYPASPYYQDGLEDWVNGRYHPMLFTRKKIEAAAEGRIILEPGG